jgi:hypothetical protein
MKGVAGIELAVGEGVKVGGGVVVIVVKVREGAKVAVIVGSEDTKVALGVERVTPMSRLAVSVGLVGALHPNKLKTIPTNNIFLRNMSAYLS